MYQSISTTNESSERGFVVFLLWQSNGKSQCNTKVDAMILFHSNMGTFSTSRILWWQEYYFAILGLWI